MRELKAKLDRIPRRKIVEAATNSMPEAPRFPAAARELAPEPFRRALDFWRSAAGPRTEAPAQFILLALSTMAGAMLGRCIFNRFARRLYPLCYAACVAPSGVKKTTAENIAGATILGGRSGALADVGVKEWRGSLGSGIGLLDALAEVGAGTPFIWLLPEFGLLLQAAARDGGRDIPNALTAIYDAPELYEHKRAKKDGQDRSAIVERPTLAVVATGQEKLLRQSLSPAMVYLGVASRFLFAYAAPEDCGRVPFPEDGWRDVSALGQIAQAIKGPVDFWRDRAKSAPDGVEIALDPAARKYWEAYDAEWRRAEAARSDGERELTRREPEHVRKLALVHAGLAGVSNIGEDALRWARSVAAYSSDCARFLLVGAGTGETQRDIRSDLIGDILHAKDGVRVPVRDLYRGPRALRDPSETYRILEDGHNTGRWEVQRGKGEDYRRIVGARCCCPPCAKRAAEAPRPGAGEAVTRGGKR